MRLKVLCAGWWVGCGGGGVTPQAFLNSPCPNGEVLTALTIALTSNTETIEISKLHMVIPR